jgi:arylsulfatase A
MKHSLILLVLIALSTQFAMASEPAKPNIVFILADDIGYREMGCFGQEKIKTPNIDRLAREGIRLTQHYCGNAVCAPSRCVLLTGKDPGRAFVRDNRSTKPEGQWPIPDSEITLAELLKEQGYATGAFGKWGLGGPTSTGQPLRQGFDRFFGYLCQEHAHSFYPSYLWDNERHIELKNNPPIPGHAGLAPGADPSDPKSYDSFKGTDYAPDRMQVQALVFLRANKDRPFFLYYPSTLPHVALHVPDAELKPYLALNWNDPPFTREKGGYTPHFTPRAAYAAMVSRLDKEVGALLDELDKLGLSQNTIVVFSSDNGTTHLKDEVDYDFFSSVGELRGLKGSLYEGGVRVPTVVRYPGKIAAGTSVDYVSGFEDWMPTLLELAGSKSPMPAGTTGLSIASALQGKSQEPRDYLYREFPGYGGQQSIRVGDWKAIRQKLGTGRVETELYDLSKDIGEKNNLAMQYPDRVKELEQLMVKARVPSADFPLKPIDK